MKIKFSHVLCAALLAATTPFAPIVRADNPIVTEVYTADPAALVSGDTVYLYTGQDESGGNGYLINRWLCYSSKDMKTWTAHGSPLKPTDFRWARGEAWASQVIEKGGKFYWYACVEHDASKPGKAIGVAVSDSPTGPFVDARGSALVSADMTPSRGNHGWEDIDPTVFTDRDGTTYIFWGNGNCYYARLKPNMTELDGPILPVSIPYFTEAPWIHKRGNLYYLSYASRFPEKIAYATATSLSGPWTYRGLLAEVAGNSNTIHQAIIEFKNQWYFVYHNGALPGGGSFRRSVCVDYLYYNPDGTMRRVVQTTEGTSLPPNAGAATSSALPALPTWNRLQSLSDPNLFVRHSNYKGVLSPAPFDPYEDTMWNAVAGLRDVKGISFESVNFPGHFLRRQGAEIVLAKNDGSAAFKRSATFIKEAGLADANWSSFRVAEAPELYLRQLNGVLRADKISSATDKKDATFRLTAEGGRMGLAPTAPQSVPLR